MHRATAYQALFDIIRMLRTTLVSAPLTDGESAALDGHYKDHPMMGIMQVGEGLNDRVMVVDRFNDNGKELDVVIGFTEPQLYSVKFHIRVRPDPLPERSLRVKVSIPSVNSAIYGKSAMSMQMVVDDNLTLYVHNADRLSLDAAVRLYSAFASVAEHPFMDEETAQYLRLLGSRFEAQHRKLMKEAAEPKIELAQPPMEYPKVFLLAVKLATLFSKKDNFTFEELGELEASASLPLEQACEVVRRITGEFDIDTMPIHGTPGIKLGLRFRMRVPGKTHMFVDMTVRQGKGSDILHVREFVFYRAAKSGHWLRNLGMSVSATDIDPRAGLLGIQTGIAPTDAPSDAVYTFHHGDVLGDSTEQLSRFLVSMFHKTETSLVTLDKLSATHIATLHQILQTH